ncbi:hypothetical protein COCON_G00023880 [Conger conger]|uniref:adenylate cyclase n=1 Tax=Conger conger TaxID=82655 RepID=A0A9Q1DXD3_CONCO|nr:hypothetical protein COCON_G00023880 [Conger conger]
MKTYLISGRKLDGSQCSCSQLGLGGRGLGGTLSPASLAHTPDVTGRDSAPPAAEDAHYTLPDPAKSPCPSCSVLVQVEDRGLEDGAAPGPGPSPRPPGPKALNGLLGPPEAGVGSSQTSLCEMLQEKQKKWAGSGAMDHSALIPLRSKNFRERSNAHFVEVIKEDSLMKDYFFRPPINKLSLNFLEPSLESAYRTSYQKEIESQCPVQTFASPRFSWFLDMLLSCAVFLALTLACFLRPCVSGAPPPTPALAFAIAAALLEGGALVLSVRMAFYLDSVLGCTRRLLCVIAGWVPLSCGQCAGLHPGLLCAGWVPRHVTGAVLVSLPVVSVFTHFPCGSQLPVQFTMFICCAVIIAIIQYSNFCQLSSWMRSVLGTAAGVALLILLYSPLCRPRSSRFPASGNDTGSSAEPEAEPGLGPEAELQAQLGPEAILAFFLVLLLLWFLNREFEVSYRLHYHGNVEADQHRIKIQNMRNQADWLLGNIIPMHVAEQLKVTQSYSKNHDHAGVIFASIVNFSEFYEESYEGGKECYRVLNELIGDFDELLRRPAFHSVEKIKTIGATYMAASGLNAQRGAGDPGQPLGHLRALFDFALEMMRVIDDFNKNMLGFQFKLRIGFNHGPLTAGVIGTTKLLYDIWGDTVNIASRMDSTGVECRVQVSEESHRALSDMGYRFHYRGTVNVKGKGQMRTFLFPESAEREPPPGPCPAPAPPALRPQLSPTEEADDGAGSSPGTAPGPAPVAGDRGPAPDAAEDSGNVRSGSGDSDPAPGPSLPNILTPPSDIAPPPNPAPSSNAAQTSSNASVDPAPLEPAGSARREEEEEEEEEEEADELTGLRAAESL